MKKNLNVLKAAAILVMILIFSSISVYASNVYTEGYFDYKVENESITITYYKGNASEVTVPNSLRGYPVSKLASGSFINCSSLRKLNLPDTIMEIEEGALPQNISVIYDSNTDKPQSSGLDLSDIQNFDNAAGGVNNSANNSIDSDAFSSEPSTVNKTNNASDFSVEEVEIMDGMNTGQSSGLDLDELNASVKKEPTNSKNNKVEDVIEENTSKQNVKEENNVKDDSSTISSNEKNSEIEKSGEEKLEEDSKENSSNTGDESETVEKTVEEEDKVSDEKISENQEIDSSEKANKEEDSSDESDFSEKTDVEATSQSVKTSTYSPVTIATVVIVLVICIIVLRKKNKK